MSEEKNKYPFFHPATKLYRFTILIFVSLLTFGSYFAYDIIGAIAPTLVKELGAQRGTVGSFYTMYSIAAILSVFIGGIFAIAGYLFIPNSIRSHAARFFAHLGMLILVKDPITKFIKN